MTVEFQFCEFRILVASEPLAQVLRDAKSVSAAGLTVTSEDQRTQAQKAVSRKMRQKRQSACSIMQSDSGYLPRGSPLARKIPQRTALPFDVRQNWELQFE